MKVEADADEFDRLLEAAARYWQDNLPIADPRRVVVVDALHQDFRVLLRTLTVANAIRRLEPSRLVVLTGTDDLWRDALWDSFDVTAVVRLARAFGADEVLDVHELVEQRLDEGSPVPADLDLEMLQRYALATVCRLELIPYPPEDPDDPRTVAALRRAAVFAEIYGDLISHETTVALVTSHVDYDQWGLATEAARRAKVPILYTQCTGSLKAYALFPEAASGERALRADLTRAIGGFFASHVWPHRDVLRPAAELVAWRAKANLGRPSWWRGGAATTLDLRGAADRAAVRAHACAQLGFDRSRPVVVVFNHAVSDGPGTNRETFGSLAEWFTETVAYARETTGVNWLFLDHPSQIRYDRTGFFASVAAANADRPLFAFRPSGELSKNLLWSMVDVGLTVRGSIGAELPAFGIPTIQAGWSEWSACGVTMVADDRDFYWKLLGATVDAITRGERVVSDEQIERARLWLWFYRSGADVVSGLVPAWDCGVGTDLARLLRVYLRHVESDGDPVFTAMGRLWSRREPVLTRFDLVTGDFGVSALVSDGEAA